ncbi:MAG TPA: carbonic anhydrase [Dermatophilaceae bacterium]|nr:carbonic anhydrase [Dermatophilaceae bacterium]
MGPRPQTPTQAWQELLEGNARFVAGTPAHPNQDATHRDRLTQGQRPIASFFGCSDSRVAAEVIFDQGLGDLFVVRTAGHVVGPTELGSLEFGVDVLEIPLIAVLGHDSCGAVRATVRAVDEGILPGGFIRDLVERITPSVLTAHRAGMTSLDQIEAEHVRQTMRLLPERSRTIAARVADGRLALIGLTYSLEEGRARVIDQIGNLMVPG